MPGNEEGLFRAFFSGSMNNVSSRRRTASTHKRTKKSSHPDWVAGLMRFLTTVVFLGVFYYFFVHPYTHRWRYVPGQDGYGVYMPDGYSVYGIDVSRYQKEIDWNQLLEYQDKEYPIRFVFVKATEGQTFRDVKFEDNFRNARRHGLIRGAYHFYTPSVLPGEQARNFIQCVNLLPGDLPPVLDVEQRGDKTKDELKQDVKSWLRIVGEHYGVKPILYASWKFKETYLRDEELDAYPFWIAHYYVDSVRYTGKWHFWQHTDIATIPGIKTPVDLNIFHGTVEELTRMTLR